MLQLLVLDLLVALLHLLLLVLDLLLQLLVRHVLQLLLLVLDLLLDLLLDQLDPPPAAGSHKWIGPLGWWCDLPAFLVRMGKRALGVVVLVGRIVDVWGSRSVKHFNMDCGLGGGPSG